MSPCHPAPLGAGGLVEDKTSDVESAFRGDFDRRERVAEAAKISSGDKEQGDVQRADQVADRMLGIERHHEAANALDDDDIFRRSRWHRRKSGALLRDRSSGLLAPRPDPAKAARRSARGDLRDCLKCRFLPAGREQGGGVAGGEIFRVEAGNNRFQRDDLPSASAQSAR